MKRFYAVLIVIITILSSCATTKDKTTPTNSYQFPQDWVGTYEGNLEIWNAQRGMVQSCPMTLYVSATDTVGRYVWRSEMTYNGNKIIKDYNLVTHDSMPKNHFLMDENNGIFLDRVLLDDGFYDYFEVNGIGLYGITRRVKEGITFEIASFQLKSVQYSEYEGREFKVDSVASYKVVNTQKALLLKLK